MIFYQILIDFLRNW